MRDQRRRWGGTGPHGQRRDLSHREGSAFEPQRLSRRRFPLSTPFNVTSEMKARSRLAVRRFLPMLPRDDRLTTAQTGSERIVDEAVPDPGVNPLALVTDGGVWQCWQCGRWLKLGHRLRNDNRLLRGTSLDHRRPMRQLALDRLIAAPPILRQRKSHPVAAVLGQYAVMSVGLSADAVSAHLLFPPSATVLCSARRG